MIKIVEYRGVTGCIEISNGSASVVISTAFGPRILSYALTGGENVFGWHPEAAVKTDLGEWKPYGGHRLWLAPENMPLSYSPDNGPAPYVENGELSVTLLQEPDLGANIQKQITVSLDPDNTNVVVDHRITNLGVDERKAAAWGLTILRGGGTTVIPNEPLVPYSPDTLLPKRSMALWSYTDLTDPRWTFDADAIRLRVDASLGNPQKFGVLNSVGWAAYEVEGLRFTKYFEPQPQETYPDMNSNVEVYTAGDFVELETLSPLTILGEGDAIEHRETWELTRL